jgi:release factor glutamine methyltransferase
VVVLVLVTGLQGTGKSTVAERCADVLDASLFAWDWVMAALTPLEGVQETLQALDRPTYRSVGWAVMWQLSRAQLQRGKSVVLDGLVRDNETSQTRALAREHGVECLVVLMTCDDLDLQRSRVEGRTRGIPGWYELTWDHVVETRRSWQPPGDPDVVLDGSLAAGCVAAADEADELIAAAPDDESLEAWIRRREQGEPLSWIIGTTRFCGHTLRIDRGVYVPRSQSEELARRAAALLPADGGKAVDLCTGSGAIAVHLIAELPAATVIGIDIDIRAARCALRNGVPTLIGDVDATLRPKMFDVVTAVAPYVPTGELRLLPADVQRYEPRLALDGGGDGLQLIRRIVVAAAHLLRRGGWLLLELGGEQDRALSQTLTASGFDAMTSWFDEDGDLRGLAARASGRRR